MRTILILIVALLLASCGESVSEYRERQEMEERIRDLERAGDSYRNGDVLGDCDPLCRLEKRVEALEKRLSELERPLP